MTTLVRPGKLVFSSNINLHDLYIVGAELYTVMTYVWSLFCFFISSFFLYYDMHIEIKEKTSL
jgi:hypothetical protein